MNQSKYIESSVNEKNKAISCLNNYFEPNRAEEFIIHSHIAINRLLIAYCIKNKFDYKKK